MNYPSDIITIQISTEMLNEAKKLAPSGKINRTCTSKDDSLIGLLGEFVWFQFRYGDWKKRLTSSNKGKIDDKEVEVKTSEFHLNPHLNLLVREDYKEKRKPPFYVQVIIDNHKTRGHICGFATNIEIEEARKKDFGSKFGGKGGYECYYLPILKLHPIMKIFKDIGKV